MIIIIIVIIAAETTHVCVHEQGVQEYRIASGFGTTINDLLPLKYTISYEDHPATAIDIIGIK